MDILRVFLLRDWKISFSSQFSMCLDHPDVTICNHWIKKLRNIDLVPGSTEDQIAHKYLVFERGPETTWLNTFLNRSFNCAAYPTHCSELRAREFSSLKIRVEHTLDESGVLVNFEWLANQLQLFHNFELRVNFNNNTCCTDSEVTLVSNCRYAEESCADGVHGWIENTVTETKFGSVLYHSHVYFGIPGLVLHCKHRDRLELSPANRKR